MADDDKRSPIAVIGDTSAHEALRAAGLDAFALDSPQDRLRPDEGANARVVVVQAEEGGGARAASFVKGVRAEAPLTDVVVWAPGCSAAMVREVLRCGASDVVLDRDPESLVKCVEETIERQRLLPAVERLAAGPTGDRRTERVSQPSERRAVSRRGPWNLRRQVCCRQGQGALPRQPAEPHYCEPTGGKISSSWAAAWSYGLWPALAVAFSGPIG